MFTFSAFMIHNLYVQLIGAVFVLCLYLWPSWRFARFGLKQLAPVWLFVAIIAIWHGVRLEFSVAAEICLRLLATIGLANLVTMTTRLDDLVAVVNRLAHPLNMIGLRLPGIGLLIALVIRFTPTIANKGLLLAESWRSRARRRRLSWRIVAPLVVLAIDDSEHVAESLRARGGIK